MSFIRTTLALAFLLSFTLVSSAADTKNFYVSAFGGFAFLDDHSFSTGAGGVGSVSTESDYGSVFKYAMGYRGDGLRVEGELAMRENDVDSHKVGGSSQPGSNGSSDSLAIMVNVFRDFRNVNEKEGFAPFLGFGLGMANVGYDDYTVQGVPTVLHEHDLGLAYQLMAGFSYPLAEYIDFTAEYQYFTVTDLDVKTELGDNNTSIDYDAHNIIFGVRFWY